MDRHSGTILLNKKQIEIWEGLRQRLLAHGGEVAGLFRGWKPEDYETSPKRILYVGKATSGPFHEQDVESFAFNGDGVFWAFAKQLATELGSSPELLTCIAWSNISKVSRPQIKADPAILKGFEEQAVSTLEYEIDLLKPTAIVFVTKDFNDFVVNAIGGNQSAWNKSENETLDEQLHDVWWRRRSDGVAVIWMRHPLGAKMELRNYAASKIASLA